MTFMNVIQNHACIHNKAQCILTHQRDSFVAVIFPWVLLYWLNQLQAKNSNNEINSVWVTYICTHKRISEFLDVPKVLSKYTSHFSIKNSFEIHFKKVHKKMNNRCQDGNWQFHLLWKFCQHWAKKVFFGLFWSSA